MKLAWNAIVKNEYAIIERCVESLLPYIDCAIVVDTGSTDGTQQFLMQKFEMANKPLAIYQKEFVNFEQARNEALRKARESELDWDYLLLADADMELRVRDPHWVNGHTGLSYDMRQVGGALGYYNRRLVSRKANGWFVGVTHEYLDVPSDGALDGADFLDHADGHNRPDKCLRDIALLEEALRTETRPGLIERYTFYLANSYFDTKDWAKALVHYARRVELGGFDEERWYAQLRVAHCYKEMGAEAAFVWNALRAYHMRPQRAESLYDLSRYFRERGENHVSLLFSEAGMQLPPARRDLLFVNDWIYDKGLKEEFAICGYYSQRHRRTAAKEANRLALAGSEQASGNLFWYLNPLSEAVPSFKAQPIGFTPPDGWEAMNPSVINHDGEPFFLVRTVNYTITPEGQYRIRASDGAILGDHPIRTRNFIGPISGEWHELEPPDNFTQPQYSLVLGFEDSRLFEWRGEFWTLSTVRELNHEGWCEQVLAPVRSDGCRWKYGNDWQQIRPIHRAHEKNWMPWVRADELCFVYRLGTLIYLHGGMIEVESAQATRHISGGSQVVKIDERTNLALVHEARTVPGRSNRYYQHRFVVLRPSGLVERISAPFFFHDRQIEFAAGLAVFNKQLMVSYGVRDCEAWTATMDVNDVLQFIYRDAL
jgi:glycosyltransferase involved in cell wall biosynthesis